jgi:hypothetical protein
LSYGSVLFISGGGESIGAADDLGEFAALQAARRAADSLAAASSNAA